MAKISENAMTALSLVFPVQNLINAVMIGFGVGVNAAIAYFLGAKDTGAAGKSASQGMLYSTFHGIVFTVLCIMGMPFFLRLFSANEEIVQLGIQYSDIAFLFSLVIAWQMVFEKTFQAVGRMTTTMICMMVGFVINIVLDPVLIFGLCGFPQMGIRGAALATGLGQTISLLFYIGFYIFAPISVKFTWKDTRPNIQVAKRLYAVGIPGGLNLALPSLLISVLNVIQGMRPAIGYNYGAREYERVHKIFRVSCLIRCSTGMFCR